jgi:hypothetical protein
MSARTREDLARDFRTFAAHADQTSPLYALLAARIAEDDALLALASATQASQPTPNMLLATAHDLLLGGLAHPAARFYPSVGGNDLPSEAAFQAFRDLCLGQREALVAALRTRRTQTNEVGRCAYLLPAFAVAAELGGSWPLALIEIGPSAGLNMAWDRYGYGYGADLLAGDPNALVQIRAELRGNVRPPIPERLPAVVWRRGVEYAPINLEDPAATRWLEALVWPEHLERAARLRAAINEARRDPPPIIAGDALELLSGLIAAAPAESTVCVYHTHVTYQFTPAQRNRLEELLAEAGRARPVVRIGSEGVGAASPELRLTRYAGGVREERALARVAGHGAWMEWREL